MTNGPEHTPTNEDTARAFANFVLAHSDTYSDELRPAPEAVAGASYEHVGDGGGYRVDALAVRILRIEFKVNDPSKYAHAPQDSRDYLMQFYDEDTLLHTLEIDFPGDGEEAVSHLYDGDPETPRDIRVAPDDVERIVATYNELIAQGVFAKKPATTDLVPSV